VKLAAELRRFAALQRARGIHSTTVGRFGRDVGDLMGFLRRRGKEDLREIEDEDLVAYLLELERRRELNAESIASRLNRLRRFFAYLEEKGRLLRDPSAGLRRKPVPRRLREGLTEHQVEALLEAVDTKTLIGVRDRAMLELLYSSGLRSDELLSLELDDLDLASGFVTVRASKNGEGRRVPMGRVAARWVARYLAEARSSILKDPSLIVFLGEKAGKRLWNATVNQAIGAATKKARLKRHVSAHLLRHTFAIHLLRNGDSSRHVQEMLGHRKLDSTELYTRLLVEDLKRVHRRCHPNERKTKSAKRLKGTGSSK